MSDQRLQDPLAGYPIFYHWHPAKLKSVGAMGWWLELWDGSMALVPSGYGKPLSECAGPKPQGWPDWECPRCGWVGKVIKDES